jgi:hypothetical protein
MVSCAIGVAITPLPSREPADLVASHVAEADTAAGLRLTLNLPAYRLDVHEGARRVRRYEVAIGSAKYPTPVGSHRITALELNPSWTPPNSAWAQGRAAARPGPANPMGRVKLFLLPLYYLHGTPDSLSIGRAASHGCVRLRNRDALELARLALAAGAPELPDTARLRLLRDSTRTHRIALTHPVEVAITYELLEIVDDRVHAYPDVYRRRTRATDRAAQDLLRRAAAPRPVPDGLATRLLDAARRREVSLPLDALDGRPAPLEAPPMVAAATSPPPCAQADRDAGGRAR